MSLVENRNEYGIRALSGCNIRPAMGKIFVRMVPVESKSNGGIILQGKDAPQENQCIIVALSDGQINANGDIIAHNYEVDDHLVINPPFNPATVPVAGHVCTILTEADILGVVLPELEEMGLADAVSGTAVA